MAAGLACQRILAKCQRKSYADTDGLKIVAVWGLLIAGETTGQTSCETTGNIAGQIAGTIVNPIEDETACQTECETECPKQTGCQTEEFLNACQLQCVKVCTDNQLCTDGQKPDERFNPIIADPAYPIGKGPVVVI